MNISQLQNSKGNPWSNHIVVSGATAGGNLLELLQSYDSKVALVDYDEKHITLGDNWDYSVTTMKAVYKFLNNCVGFGKLSASKVRKALELGKIQAESGETWTIHNGAGEYFDIVGVLQ